MSSRVLGRALSPPPWATPLVPCTALHSTFPCPTETVFSVSENWLLTIIPGVAMLSSPPSVIIYLAVLDTLQKELRTTAQNVNLAIKAYLIFQALAPALFGNPVGRLGCRPVFLSMFALYTMASVGLAAGDSFLVLILSCVLQSLGCPAAIVVAYGVATDITTAAEGGIPCCVSP